MMAVISYDICNARRLQRMYKFMCGIGRPSQRSVFECELTWKNMEQLRVFCTQELDLSEDSVRIYRLCDTCRSNVALLGQGFLVLDRTFEVW